MPESFLGDLAIALCVASLTSIVARAFKIPQILAYLVAGLIVGPNLPIPLFADHHRIEILSEFGVIFVMFSIGLEFRLKRFIKILPSSGFAALIQISFLFLVGFMMGDFLEWPYIESIFLGFATSISSTMVVSRLFKNTKVDPPFKDYVLGILIVQDVSAIVMIALATGIAAGTGLTMSDLFGTLRQLAIVLFSMLVLGHLFIPPLIRFVSRMHNSETLAIAACGVCFSFALTAQYFGYSVALGAFIAGVLVAESGEGAKIEHLLETMKNVFAAIFFVSVGMAVEPSELSANFGVSLLLAVVIILAQLLSVGCASLVIGKGLRTSLHSGLSLGQVGEFSFIIAAIGMHSKAVGPTLQPILVTVAVITAFTTPVLFSFREDLVGLADRILPSRVRLFLSFYDSWIDSSKKDLSGSKSRSLILRSFSVAVLDFALLGVLLASVFKFKDHLFPFAGKFGVDRFWFDTGVELFVAMASFPFLLALLWNVRVFFDHTFTRTSDLSAGDSKVSLDVRRVADFTTVGVFFLILQIASGLLFSSFVLFAVYSVLLVVSFYMLWRSAGVFQTKLRSGAEMFLNFFPKSIEEAPEHTELPEVMAVEITDKATCIGKTLADLNLRARTGASVISIVKSGNKVTLPNGKESLEKNDVLQMVGSSESLKNAKAILFNQSDPTPRRP